MASPQLNPRRRYLNRATPTTFSYPSYNDNDYPKLPSLDSNQSLKKSATFHSPTTPPSQDDDPIVNIPLLPKRSPTCPRALENAVAAGQSRVAHLLGVVDRSLSGLENFSSDSQETLRAECLPVPRFMLDSNVDEPTKMDIDRSSDSESPQTCQHQHRRKHHSSDSGIGSSVTGSDESLFKAAADHKPNEVNRSTPSAVTEIQSGINGSTVSNTGPHDVAQHALSEYACRQIQKHIILPIVSESSLKDFHPLVTGIPYRVGRKEITCLRDLEKVLLWLAPVRQYAAMITASRERMAAGRVYKEDEVAADERLGLHGGLSQNGRPVELVRIKNGQSISLRTGSVISSETARPQGLKRSVSEESDEDVMRSMARRRKAAQATVKDVQQCSECEKVFKRPCDLTKHEKTHSRPWKCSESNCKYHIYGWPTEKERDRHVNDKHSTTPSMFKCQYRPCPYESKRESNCKQHMEKAHGWAYVRSKNNGKSGKKLKGGKTPPTPQISTPGSYIFDASSPETGEAPNSYIGAYSNERSMDGSAIGSEDSTPHSAIETPFMGMDDTFCPFDPTFAWNESWNGLAPPGASDYTPDSHRLSWDGSMTNAPTLPSSFETSLTPSGQDPIFTANFDWSNLGTDNTENTDYTSMNIQLITPASSIDTRSMDAFSRNPSISLEEPLDGKVPSLSPGAQGNVMLYSPYSQNENTTDEGYGDFVTDAGKPATDFPLFGDSHNASSLSSADNEQMFQDLATFVPSPWSGRGTELAQQLGMNELMQVDEE